MRKDRSFEAYENCGAWIRLLYGIACRAFCECSKTFTQEQCSKLERAIELIDGSKCEFDRILFDAHPSKETRELTSVFYGMLDGVEPMCSVDSEVKELALKNALSVFGRKMD